MQATSLPKNSRLIFKGIVGSHSYNLNTETSDIDYKGVYIQDEEDILSDNYIEFVQVNADECYFELRKFLQLIAVANPNAMEMLYLPDNCIEACEPEFIYLMHKRDSFLTKRCGATFSGYAKTQLRKSRGLGKKLNWEKHKTERKNILDFCKVIPNNDDGSVYTLRNYLKSMNTPQSEWGLVAIDGFKDTYKMYHSSIYDYRGIIKDDSTNEPRLSEIPKHHIHLYLGIMFWNREAYTIHCKDYAEYQKWLSARNENRYVTNKAHGQTYDGKNILHTVRLIMTAEHIATHNTLNIDMTENRDFLLSIKKGLVNLKEVTEEWSQRAEKIDDLFALSTLPDELPKGYIKELEFKIRKL